MNPENRAVEKNQKAKTERNNVSKQNNVFGLHALESVLKHRPMELVSCFILNSKREEKRVQSILALAEVAEVKISWVEKEEIEKYAPGARHQGVVGVLKAKAGADHQALVRHLQTLERAQLLVLDSVQDPHNLGACIRSAAAAGFDAVVVPKDRAVGLTAAVRKVASGAAELMPFFQVTNLARTLRALKKLDIWVIGLAMDADQSLYDVDLPRSVAVVLGGEAKGLRPLIRTECDFLVSIPMATSLQSLNVSVAAGVTMFEIKRQFDRT